MFFKMMCNLIKLLAEIGFLFVAKAKVSGGGNQTKAKL